MDAEEAAPAPPSKFSNRFRPGNPGKPKGAVSHRSRDLKEAILGAARDVGEDGKGADGLRGYLRFVARKDPKAYCALLGRVLPLQLQGDPNNPLQFRLTVEYTQAQNGQPLQISDAQPVEYVEYAEPRAENPAA